MTMILVAIAGVVVGAIVSRVTLPAGQIQMTLRQIWTESRRYLDHLDGAHDPKLCSPKDHADSLIALNSHLIKRLMKAGI